MKNSLTHQRSSDKAYATLKDWIQQEAIQFSIDSHETFNTSVLLTINPFYQ